MVRETGWTLDQIDALTVDQWHEYFIVKDARAKAIEVRRQAEPRRKVR